MTLVSVKNGMSFDSIVRNITSQLFDIMQLAVFIFMNKVE